MWNGASLCHTSVTDLVTKEKKALASMQTGRQDFSIVAIEGGGFVVAGGYNVVVEGGTNYTTLKSCEIVRVYRTDWMLRKE